MSKSMAPFNAASIEGQGIVLSNEPTWILAPTFEDEPIWTHDREYTGSIYDEAGEVFVVDPLFAGQVGGVAPAALWLLIRKRTAEGSEHAHIGADGHRWWRVSDEDLEDALAMFNGKLDWARLALVHGNFLLMDASGEAPSYRLVLP